MERLDSITTAGTALVPVYIDPVIHEQMKVERDIPEQQAYYEVIPWKRSWVETCECCGEGEVWKEIDFEIDKIVYHKYRPFIKKGSKFSTFSLLPKYDPFNKKKRKRAKKKYTAQELIDAATTTHKRRART